MASRAELFATISNKIKHQTVIARTGKGHSAISKRGLMIANHINKSDVSENTKQLVSQCFSVMLMEDLPLLTNGINDFAVFLPTETMMGGSIKAGYKYISAYSNIIDESGNIINNIEAASKKIKPRYIRIANDNEVEDFLASVRSNASLTTLNMLV